MIGKQTFRRVPTPEYLAGFGDGDDVDVTSFNRPSQIFKAEVDGMGTFCLRAEDWETLGRPDRIELTITALVTEAVAI